jgi:lipopolysaccharide export system permease protein
MYVESLSRDRQRAENVFLAQEKLNASESDDAQTSWMLVFASQGYQVRDRETRDLFFVTTDGYRYEGRPGDNDYKIVQFKKYAVRIPQADIRVAHPESEGMSTSQLWQGYDNPKYAGELQWRFSIAIATILLALLAVPLSAVKPRRGRFAMVLPAVLIYIIYINLLFVARRWVDQGSLSIALGMWWVHLLMLGVIATVMLLRSNTKFVSR